METNGTGEKAAEAQDQGPIRNGTYEILRNRLASHGKELRVRLDKLNQARKAVFGGVDTRLLSSQRISTANNCVPRDMVPVGDRFIFGYNVFVGLRAETKLEDVFAIYQWKGGAFVSCPLDAIRDPQFETDFKNLYRYYRKTVFAKFSVIGHHLYMIFRVGREVVDIKAFKWLIEGNTLQYVDARSEHECGFPAQHQFEWRRTTQDMIRQGKNPHISIEDRVFVETIGGDLTIKIENNTETGKGIYSEPVDNADQTLNDAEIYYAVIGNVIVLKVRPYEEKRFRYFLYNEKVRKAIRLDAIEQACLLLPEDHGLIFAKGYYLQTGEIKQFELQTDDMVFEKRLDSPNGEDYLYVFHNRHVGVYILLSYNLIEQKVGTPVVCNGYSLFEDGMLVHFRADSEAKRHHVLQLWQTPYYGPDFHVPVKQETELYKIGNRDIVRCMAECTEILALAGREETYLNLYLDIARKAEEIQDAYFWIASPETFHLDEPLAGIRQAAQAAVDEYEKVVRTKANTKAEIDKVVGTVREIIAALDYDHIDEIGEYVEHLTRLRAIRGTIISLRDLRYADVETITSLEKEVAEHTEKLSRLCVEFLLKPESLDPYRKTAEEQKQRVPDLAKVADAKQLQQQVAETAAGLEMLTDVVSNLKIEDATQTIAVIDHISLVYSQVNQVKSALTNRLKELGRVEGRAEFTSQLKLIDQSVISYLDVCDTPEKCQEYLTKAMVQLETLEGKFADFDEFIVQLTEKREEVCDAFESRKVRLLAERNQRASALMASAERILKGVTNRVRTLTEIDQINGYFASDLMIDRVRETIEQLKALGDAVKAEDIANRLKTIHQDTIRQLKDKQALYEDDDRIIRLGNHRFAVNRQPLEGTVVQKDGRLCFHLTGTGFFEPMEDQTLEQTRDVWDLTLVSETPEVYRAEYLAFKMFQSLLAGPAADMEAVRALPPAEVLTRVQSFMGPRYDEGYIKGVHDHDAAMILWALLDIRSTAGLLRYDTRARAVATLFWHAGRIPAEEKAILRARITGMGYVQALFGSGDAQAGYIAEIKAQLDLFAQATRLLEPSLVQEAAEYLFYELAGEDEFVLSQTARDLKDELERCLTKRGFADSLKKSTQALSQDPVNSFRLVADWARSYLVDVGQGHRREYAEEVAALLMPGLGVKWTVIPAGVERDLAGMAGSHPRIEQGGCRINYCHFMARLQRHEQHVAPRFAQYVKCRNAVVERYSRDLHLDEFQPHVLTTFVRNTLIDKIYLPLIGANLAKQIGAAGQEKRTDRQGLLLLISPPGYGKTTLLEYVANRLGLTFVKINGPAVGSRVVSLDPAEAPNAAAREELMKLNLALEMGDNIMIYVDDIQHTNPEFLQKFISLCDAQRRIEGVYRGRARTYDLRGKRACVVMAGNPYTESGKRFRIPDMLANRADTYNIGDIVGDNYDQFVLSYVENCLTSNPVLEKLTRRSHRDACTILQIAETGQREGLDFEGNYTAEEVQEYVAVMKKLLVVRDVVLKVNREYIRSAGQADEYRTEPPFLLQGSYRNMNRIAERVLAVMNDEELWTLIHSTYEQDAQMLTSGAESNLLKFRELTGRLNAEQAHRWAEIKKTFGRNLLLGGDSDDKIGKIVRQLNAFTAGLDSIKEVLADGVTAMRQPAAGDGSKAAAEDVLARMDQLIAGLKRQQTEQAASEKAKDAEETARDARTLVAVLEEQFRAMETWLLPMTHGDKAQKDQVIGQLMERFEIMVRGYNRLIDVLRSHRQDSTEKPVPQQPQVFKGPPKTKRKTPPSDRNA
ncbi:MAG: DNA repair ATPase [Phycisphaerae bacterium]|nr:DNA repair ATPase [Phycisphaerae bacterium]